MKKINIVIVICFILHITKSQVLPVIKSVLDVTRPINADTVKETISPVSEVLPLNLSGILNILENNGVTSTYNVKTSSYPNYDEYDFIIVGAGTAGSTVANRLSENKSWKVLLLEAGGQENLLIQVPSLFAATHQTDFNWGYRVEPQKNACYGMIDERCTWPRGKVLGGTSSINAMIYTRGNRRDYDLWASMGNDGWSYNDVLPYFIKSENFQVKESYADRAYHGTDGNVCVQDIPYRSPLATTWLDAGVELGYDIVDYNGPEQLGFSYLQVNEERGARCSAGRAYLRVDRPNFDIVPHAMVTKVLINDDNRAYGVEYIKNGDTFTVEATKEVILSTGTIGTAQLLMLSGIGPQEHLEELGIDVIQNSKVGYNMYEHIAFWGLLFTVNESVALNVFDLFSPENALEYALYRNGPFSTPLGAESISFIQTKLAPDDRPDIELLFIDGGVHSDIGLTVKPSYGISDEVYNKFYKPLETSRAYTVWPIVQHPKSYGRLTLKSKNPFDYPILDANFFSHPNDLDTIVEGIKHAIEISQTKAFQQYNAQVYNRKMPGCETHEFGTDDYWKCAVKVLPVMENHEMGTAKMGPEYDSSAVVDPKLRVYGIDRLRVIDASIMPTMTTGHINGVVYMIGEKGADMIKKTWADI